MTISAPVSRPFEPGTTGWSIADLNDPQVEREWELGAYEIVEGVLTRMPAAYFGGSVALSRLVRIVERHLEGRGQAADFPFEVDIVISPQRVARVDAVLLTPEDQRRQKLAVEEAGGADVARSRILIAPTLIIESLSIGHEAHDRLTKRRWYAERGVSNYWVLDAYQHTLECLTLEGSAYRTDQSGRGNDELRPGMFPGLIIPLGQLWAE
jgi:Uma2 family endonuclease